MKELTKNLKTQINNLGSIEERLSFLKDKYKDETAYIVTCGPSLKKHDVRELNQRLKDKLVISIKQGYNVVKDVTDFHLMNTYNFSPYTWRDDTIVFWSLSKSYADEQLNRIVGMNAPLDLFIPVINPPYIDRTQTIQAKCSWDDFYMMENQTEVKFGVGMMYELGIPFTMLLGCKKVVVLGWDLGDPKGNPKDLGHSYTHSVEKITRPEEGEIAETMRSTESLYDWLDDKGIDFRILSDESYVSSKFKRMKLSDIKTPNIYEINQSDVEKIDECDLCGSTDIETISELSDNNGLTFLSTGVCKNCNLVFRNTRPKLSWFEHSWKLREEDAQAVWRQAHNKDWEKKRYDRYENLASTLEGIIETDKRRLLDVGCGPGSGLNSFVDRGWDVVGLEPDPVRSKIGPELYGLDVKECTVEEFKNDGEKFDIATILHVVEHFHKPKDFLKHVMNQVKDDGYIYIEVPHLHHYCNWTDSLMIEHMNNYTEKTLTMLGESVGLSVVDTFVTKTKEDGFHHQSILFTKNKNYVKPKVPKPKNEVNNFYIKRNEKPFEESDWNDWFRFDKNKSYVDNVKYFYRSERLRLSENWAEEINPDTFWPKGVLKFKVPYIDQIQKLDCKVRAIKDGVVYL